MRLQEAIETHPDVRIFQVENSDSDQKGGWEVQIADAPVLSQENGIFILKAKNILPDGTIRDCYIDVSMPERVSDHAYQIRDGVLEARYHHEFEGEIICGVPISSFGVYELFHSKNQPEIGIEVLKGGIDRSPKKAAIAEDLGYILRDEGRFPEAAEAFEIAAQEGPSSYFIYGELAVCYDETGNEVLADKYRQMLENH
jgi:tetratricopeptide (TPR) repeat protein